VRRGELSIGVEPSLNRIPLNDYAAPFEGRRLKGQ